MWKTVTISRTEQNKTFINLNQINDTCVYSKQTNKNKFMIIQFGEVKEIKQWKS